MKKVLVAAVAALLLAVPAFAARHDNFPLHPHSSGPRVAALQWLLHGGKPNIFHVKATFKREPNGYWGALTTSALDKYRFRLGWPGAGQCGSKASAWKAPFVTRYFFAIIEGKKRRPLCWAGLAAKRIAGTVVPGATKAALAIQAFDVSQLGVSEQPLGSNRGPRISYASAGFGPYQGATGAYGLAWCASFADYALKRTTGRGFGSTNDAYVPTILYYAQARGWIQAKPKVGSFVGFLDAAGNVKQLGSAYHIGYVVRVTASGIQTVEGNYNDGVREVWRAFNAWNMVYVDVPGVA